MCFLKAMLFFSVVFTTAVFADKESEKSRLDDCFYEIQQMLNVMNSMQGTSDGPAFNNRFLNKKARCHEIKGAYEKKYGKYVIPGSDKKPQPKVDISKINTDEIVTGYCEVQDRIQMAEEQAELQIDNPTSVAQWKDSIKLGNEQSNKIKKLYKDKTKSEIDPDICYINHFSSITGWGTKPFLEDSVAINKYFCRLQKAKTKDFLNRVQKKLSGEEAHCAK